MKIIITCDKGGVGKSTVAQFCIAAHLNAGVAVRIVEYDRQHKLLRLFGEKNVISNSIGGEYRSVGDDTSFRTDAEFWDPFVKWLKVEKPLIADFGAQVWQNFVGWAEDAMLSTMSFRTDIVVLVPVTADVEAVVAALNVVQTCPRILPTAQIKLLLIPKDGDIGLLKGIAPYEQLMAEVKQRNLSVIALPRLALEGYPALAGRGIRFDEIYQATPVDLVHRAGLSQVAAARTIKAVRLWVDQMTVALKPVLPEKSRQPITAP